MVCGPPGKRGLFAPYLVLVGLKLDSVNAIVRLQSMTVYHVTVRTLIAKNVTIILVQSTDSGLSGYHGNHVLPHVVEAHVTGTGLVMIPRLRTEVRIVRTTTVRCHHVLNFHAQVLTCVSFTNSHQNSLFAMLHICSYINLDFRLVYIY